MNYLKYIEHDAENLQFYLWARAYIKKFNELSDRERSLSPEWNPSQNDIDNLAGQSNANRQMKVSADTAKALQGTGLEPGPRVTETPIPIDEKSGGHNPFYTPPRTPSEESRRNPPPSEFSSNDGKSFGYSSHGMRTGGSASNDFARKAGGAYDDAGLKWQPCKCGSSKRANTQ